MPDLRNCTLNGVPLEKVFVEETVREMKTNHQEVVSALNFVKRVGTVSKSRYFRNISGSRSSRGRVVYSRTQVAMGGAL